MMPKIATRGRLAANLDDDEWDALLAPIGLSARAANPSRSRPRPKKKTDHMIRDEIAQHAGSESTSTRMGADRVFNPTFSSSKHERAWILEYLGHFYDDNLLLDVLRKVKAGKEATVYCCSAHPSTGLELVAAKVYRPRMFRQLRNDVRYRQGRAILDDRGKVVRDERLLVAVAKKSSTGLALAHTSWLEYEYDTLRQLHEAGGDVPRPLARDNSTILMEYIGEADAAAPLLQEIRLEPDEVEPLFERLMGNIRLMLSLGRIHGDLSAYNVLYWEGDIKLIDFPQVVAPSDNEEAYAIFERDVIRICQYFARQGLRRDARKLAGEMWARHGVTRPLPVDLLGDEESLL
jgi:RIO kinase 1